MPRRQPDQLESLFAIMNDVAAGLGEWSEVLGSMERLLEVEATSIEVFDKRTGALSFLATRPVDPAEQRHYEEHVFKLNPRYALLPDLPVGEVRADRHVDPELEAAAGEYYEWLTRAAGVRYFAGIKLFETSEYLAVSSIHVPASRGPIETELEGLFAGLAPHLANALSVHRALAGSNGKQGKIGSDGDMAGRAYALLDRDGRILECSAAFEKAVERSGTVKMRDGRLIALRTADSAALARLIGRALKPSASTTSIAPVRIPHAKGRHGILVRAVRLERSRELFARLRPVAMLVLIDLDAPGREVGEALRAAWGLTPREAELAALLGEGKRLDRAARMLGMTEQTARTHLKRIFRRMEIERQTDLVRIVARLGS